MREDDADRLETEEEVAGDVRRRVLSRTEPLVLYLAMPAGVLFTVREQLAGRHEALPVGVLQVVFAIAILVARRRGDQMRGLVITAYAIAFGTIGIYVYGPLLGVGVIYTLSIVASAGLLGRRFVLPAAAVVVTCFVVVATLKLTGIAPAARAASVDLGAWSTWVRIGGVLGIGAFIAGVLQTYIVKALELAAGRSNEALERERAERIEREKTQEALARAQRLEAVGRLAAGVAHDLNNALAVVVCSAESLRDLKQDDVARNELIADLLGAARGAEATTRQLTMLGRKDTFRPEQCRPAAVTEQLARSINRLLPPSITVVVEATSKHAVPLARSRLEQIVLNLVLNARDAMPRGGTLRIVVTDEGEQVIFVVEDTGVGMSEEARQRIFEPFFTTKEAGRGSGLGLSMVHAMVTEAGGSIDVTSTLGKGTSFRLALPAQAGPTAIARETPFRAPNTQPRGARILLVEDEPSMLRAIARVLRASGHEVHAASEGAEADAALALGKPFDLLLTDAVIPGTDTAAMIDRFLAANPDKPVLVCSGYVKEEVMRQGIAAGKFHFLQKPFRPTEISAAVDAALASVDDPG